MSEENNGFGVAPENRIDFEPYDIYRKLTKKEKDEMQEQIEKDTVRFASELDEKFLPLMPKTKSAKVLEKRKFLGIMAERRARLEAQKRWLQSERAKNRKE